MYTMTLSDGSKIEGLRLVNNCLVSSNEITPAMLKGKLAPVTISGSKSDNDDEDWGGLIGEHKHAGIAYIKHTQEGYAIALYDIPDDQWNNAKRDGNIAYIAMMTGIQL